MTAVPLSDEQHTAIRARQNLAHDPDACGTCRRLVAAGKAPEHSECERRPFLIPAPDQPDYEALADMTDEERQALPARFHIPGFEGNATPNAWLCQVCWGDGWVTQWPCKPALDGGRVVFAAQHHGERARWDGARLLAELDRLRAELATARADAINEAIGSFTSLANLAPDSHRAPGLNFAIGVLMAMRDRAARTAAADAPHPN